MSVSNAPTGLWGALDAELRADPADRKPEAADAWAVLTERVDVGELRPKLADDIEVKEFHLRWGNDYAMVANPARPRPLRTRRRTRSVCYGSWTAPAL